MRPVHQRWVGRFALWDDRIAVPSSPIKALMLCPLLLAGGCERMDVVAQVGQADSALCPPATCSSGVTDVCGLLPQCGCPCDLACQIEGSGPTVCAQPGTAGLDELCVAQGDCARGLACTPFEHDPGLCRPYCRSSDDCGGRPCVPLVAGDTMSRPDDPIGGCSVECDLSTGGGCPSPLVCRAATFTEFDLSHSGAKFCSPPPTVGPGDPCTEQSVCPVNHMCVLSLCRQLCVVGQRDCPSSVRCQALTVPVRLDGVEYGACP